MERTLISSIVAELRELLKGRGIVDVYRGCVRVSTLYPFEVWDRLSSYCGDLVVYNAGREGLFYTVRLLCVEKKIEFYLEIRRINRIFYLHPMLALFKDEVFSYT